MMPMILSRRRRRRRLHDESTALVCREGVDDTTDRRSCNSKDEKGTNHYFDDDPGYKEQSL